MFKQSNNSINFRRTLAIIFACSLTLALIAFFSGTKSVSSKSVTAKNYDAASILKKIYNLSEFPDSKQTPQSYVLQGTVEHSDLTGEFNNTYDKDRGYVSSFDLGILKFSQGFEGGTGWESNPNGIVNDIARLNEDLLVLGRIIESKEYLSASESALDRVCLGSKNYHDRGVYHFQFVAHDGITGDAFIDSLNGEVLGLFVTYDFVEAEIEFSDYREVEGYSFAFRSELTASISDLNMIAQAASCLVNKSIPDETFERPDTDWANVTYPTNCDSIVMPLEYVSGHLYFHLRVNGSEPLLFLLDSGAGGIVIDAIHVERLGLKEVGSQLGLGIAGTQEFSLTVLEELNLEGIVFKNQVATVMDYGDGLRNSLRGIVGIIGYDFLARFVATVDYDENLLTVYPPTHDLTVQAQDITAVLPVKFYFNLPTVTASVNDKSGMFVVDVGSGYGPLLNEYFVNNNSLQSLPDRYAPNDNGYIGGVGGALPTRTVTIENFLLETLQIEDQAAWTILGSTGMAASNKIAGNLGNGFFDQFRLTFDYPHNRLILHD